MSSVAVTRGHRTLSRNGHVYVPACPSLRCLTFSSEARAAHFFARIGFEKAICIYELEVLDIRCLFYPLRQLPRCPQEQFPVPKDETAEGLSASSAVRGHELQKRPDGAIFLLVTPVECVNTGGLSEEYTHAVLVERAAAKHEGQESVRFGMPRAQCSGHRG